MALAANTAGEFTTVCDPYNLQTQQKRLRNLRSISVRNLHTGGHKSEHISRLQSYFTLHTDVDVPAFYQSEKITGSTNPSWQCFDISQFGEHINLASKFFVLRVWVGQQENFRLLILMEVHLTGLNVLADELQQVLVKHNPNTVIFGMLDKEFIFVNKEQTRVKNLIKKVADLDLPASLLPAVVKVEQSSVRTSYTTSSLSRIQTVLRAIKQMQTHARQYRRQIEDRLLASQENSKRLEEREHLHMSVSQLRQELLRRTMYLHQSQEKLQGVREATSLRMETFKRNREAAERHSQLLQEDKRDHIVKREKLVKENALLQLRRRQMLTELFNYVYPITEDSNKYYINGVRLPHAEEFQGQDETMIAVGLGYSCHLTIKMSQILWLPLRHPMENRSSRSIIYDQVHSKLADKDREFPLYSKGKDKYHFNYGVFLLNKNISQLRFQCSLPTLDLRQTLQNLLTLMHKLGVRMEGDTTVVQSFASTSEGTALSRTSLNGSSIGTSQTPSFPIVSTNGESTKTQGSRSGHQHSKAGNISEDGSTGNLTSRPKEGEGRRKHFDESEDIFKPAVDDNFFKVSNSVMDKFNLTSAEGASLGGEDVDNDGGVGDHIANSRVSAILQTASEGETLAPKSFKLIKQSRSGSGEDKSDENDSDNTGSTNCEGDNNSNRCCDKVDDAAADGGVGSVGGEDVNGLDQQGGGEVLGGSCSRRRSSTSSGHHGEEDEHSGAAAFSEQNPRDLHSKHSSPTNSDQNCSVRDDLDTHSSQLTDSDNLVLSEDGQDLMSV